jgi:hypothetical protein
MDDNHLCVSKKKENDVNKTEDIDLASLGAHPIPQRQLEKRRLTLGSKQVFLLVAMVEMLFPDLFVPVVCSGRCERLVRYWASLNSTRAEMPKSTRIWSESTKFVIRGRQAL